MTPGRALRRLARTLHPPVRSARLMLYVLPVVLLAPAKVSATEVWQIETLGRAAYANPTSRYPHAALGDDIEYGALVLEYGPKAARFTLRLAPHSVFEDTAPRLADVDGDGRPEAVVVESHKDFGARLAIYNGGGLIAATPYIGQRFRWLAPIGVADLDGDGHVEIAYIDRPHLARTLRIWRFKDGALTEAASHPDLTNHRFGETDISGGLRNCGGPPEMIVARGDWSELVAARFDGQTVTLRTLGAQTGPLDFAAELGC